MHQRERGRVVAFFTLTVTVVIMYSFIVLSSVLHTSTLCRLFFWCWQCKRSYSHIQQKACRSGHERQKETWNNKHRIKQTRGSSRDGIHGNGASNQQVKDDIMNPTNEYDIWILKHFHNSFQLSKVGLFVLRCQHERGNTQGV